jgi:signal transduction histidine kinase/ligand-binding sensor domain-containing protein
MLRSHLWRSLTFRRFAQLQTVVILFCALDADNALALNRERSLSQLHHTAWTEREGAPKGIQALAQTDDGYLWLGTTTGLYQFDGVRFQRPHVRVGVLPSGSVFTLKAVRGGGLWIGWLFAGITFLNQGVATNYGENEGLPDGTVYDFAVDRSGTLWAGTSTGVRRFDGTRWETIGKEWGLPETRARALFIDPQGVLAVCTFETVFVLSEGAGRFVPTGGTVPAYAGFTRTPDGTIYVSEPRGIRPISALTSYAIADRSWVVRSSTGGAIIGPVARADRDGALWILTLRDGLQRIRFPERVPPAAAAVEHFSRSEGLSDDAIFDFLEDREGSVWVATGIGLDRFRESSIVPLALPTSQVSRPNVAGVDSLPAIVAADSGAVWVGAAGKWSLATPDGKLLQWRLPEAADTTATYRAANGVIALGRYHSNGSLSLVRLTADGHSTIALPPGIAMGSQIQAISGDSDGALWISVTRTGVFRQMPEGWELVSALPQQGKVAAIVMLAEADGRKWFGYPRNRLVRLEGDTAHEFSQQDGVDVGNVRALHSGRSRLWIGGDGGLAVFEGGRIRRILAAQADALNGVAGVVETAKGDLWLNASAGAILIPAAEIEKALSQVNYRVTTRVYDIRDGLAGSPPSVRPLPGAIKGTDGRIWFATTRGVFWIDPDHLVHNSLAPPVSVLSLSADGRQYDGSGDHTLPIGASNLEINYTATSLVVPDRVRFRYRLEGNDTHWQEAGSRRTAYYTNLRPGTYHFRVIASNDDGVWNEAGATQSFTIPPAFFQTTWFATCAVLLLATGVVVVYKWRVNQIGERMRGSLQQRLIERERIARELHDTLLQSIQGLILKFHAAAQQIPPFEPTRHLLDNALDGADAVITEGRNRVRDLRVSDRAAVDVADALTEDARRLGENQRAMFSAVVQGTSKALHPIVRDELYSICREALVNAYLHADARAIHLELTYGRDELRARLRDNGVGMDPDILKVGSRVDHWGLSGMRERADRIGATLEIWSRPGAGTDVDVRLPAATAYSEKAGLLNRLRRPSKR